MKRVYFKLILNTLIFSFLGFIISFVILYYFLPRAVAISTSVTLTALIALAIVFFGLRADKKQREKAEKEKAVNDLSAELCFLDEAEVYQLFYQTFTNLSLNPEKRKTCIDLPQKKQTAFFRFTFDGLKKSDIVKAFNLLPDGFVGIIYTNDCSADVLEFATRFDGRIRVANKAEVAKTLESAKTTPQIKHRLIDLKTVKKVKWKVFLDRKKAVRFLALGITFLLLSFFVPIKTYYIAFGTTLSIFALSVMFFAKSVESEKD